jgi:hypothetical protein
MNDVSLSPLGPLLDAFLYRRLLKRLTPKIFDAMIDKALADHVETHIMAAIAKLLDLPNHNGTQAYIRERITARLTTKAKFFQIIDKSIDSYLKSADPEIRAEILKNLQDLSNLAVRENSAAYVKRQVRSFLDDRLEEDLKQSVFLEAASVAQKLLEDEIEGDSEEEAED